MVQVVVAQFFPQLKLLHYDLLRFRTPALSPLLLRLLADVDEPDRSSLLHLLKHYVQLCLDLL